LWGAEGVEVLSTLDLEATPPFEYAHDHFGYRDRLSQPVIEGTGEVPTPGTGAPLKPGEFILGYPDEGGPPANLPQPEILSRNGSYMAYRCGAASWLPSAEEDSQLLCPT
jgi:deferrochelatase/peroxidase EfeB